MVTGKVAPLELVENASNCAGPIALKNFRYETPVKIFNKVG